jgi:hypothetical protein
MPTRQIFKSGTSRIQVRRILLQQKFIGLNIQKKNGVPNNIHSTETFIPAGTEEECVNLVS